MTDHSAGPMAGRLQPDRRAVLDHARFHLVTHPLADHLLAILRDSRSTTGPFVSAAERLATLLLWQASCQLPVVTDVVPGFDGSPLEVRKIERPPAGISILRAGEVFAGPFRQHFPDAPLYHIGVRRNEETLISTVYSDSTSSSIDAPEVWILDPMLATGGSVVSVIERARLIYRGPIAVLSLVTAPLGALHVLDADDNVRIVTPALDRCLNDQGYILPGLGDAGDRYFGTEPG